MNDITDFFKRLLDQHRSIDIAEAEFLRLMADDEELREEYKEWCDACGYSEKHGFTEFCEEYMDSQDSIWESLNDYDE
ncbi:MAG: hypothetical protein J6B44_02240 [Muribaculaceae bacterium]|nr:hypothetical protein [Muribaculaceae bacterium]